MLQTSNVVLIVFQASTEGCKVEPLDVPLKKPKMEELYSAYVYAFDPYIQAAAFYDQYRTFSAFRPWPNKRPFLTREPPLLQRPDKVVTFEDSSRFETNFQPNVALKPHHPPTPPSSDEITSSTSPPPAAEMVTLNLPPRDCELSTDTDDEDKEPPPDISSPSSIRTGSAEINEDFRDTERHQGERERECTEKKEMIIERQSEMIKEKDAIIAQQRALIQEKEDLIRKQDEILKQRELRIAQQLELIKQKDEYLAMRKANAASTVETESSVKSLECPEPQRAALVSVVIARSSIEKQLSEDCTAAEVKDEKLEEKLEEKEEVMQSNNLDSSDVKCEKKPNEDEEQEGSV